ncbi:MAG: bifunctional proline dehydrogenase/L-glutamate gamma-semialdehyde dehydrogenase PutA [Geminicoccaceae bacterium]
MDEVLVDDVDRARRSLREASRRSETHAVQSLLRHPPLDQDARDAAVEQAIRLIEHLRAHAEPGLMERFLSEYGLGTEEGIALMCLAEAYLRTPDAPSLDELISDKIGSRDWARHLGKAESSLINASTWTLMLTGRVFRRIPAEAADLTSVMRGVVRRLGEPVARKAVGEAMKVLGRQFVLGRTIEEALDNSAADRAKGRLHSFDMLGEAARTSTQAHRYFLAYAQAINAIAAHASSNDPWANPGISVKLSALHPRYEYVQRQRVMSELVPRLSALAEHARAANIGFNVDAEEADRLDLSLDVIEATLRQGSLRKWDGFGVVIQAYAKTAPAAIDWIAALAAKYDRRIMVRLVKGAYWDTEIKHAQVLGIPTYPVYTRKASTDLCYLACAKKLFDAGDRVYPQFATHNAHTASAILTLAPEGAVYEFQRLHGMGEPLLNKLSKDYGLRQRIYAPVGVHEDLLAYLVRRLLENGANSSFVHQILDRSVPASKIAADPQKQLETEAEIAHPAIPLPLRIFGEAREAAKGWNLNHPLDAEELDRAMAPFREQRWRALPTIGGAGPAEPVLSPIDRRDVVGEVIQTSAEQIDDVFGRSARGFAAWSERPVEERAASLRRAADLYEEHAAELMAIAAREAGKTRLDGIAEVREAVDFLRYYALQAAEQLDGGARQPLGPIVCISPWNFPLAIFTGQIAAALAAGNSAIAKPAEQTPLIAARAVGLLHEAGVIEDTLILVPGSGAEVGAALVSDKRSKGVCFTGSTETARLIDQAMAKKGDPTAPLVAETGGLNAMIVDSTALPEQAVRDIVVSAFQSAGQRCSALRILCVQADVANRILPMLEGAAEELAIGDPWDPATDVGPVIDTAAQNTIVEHCERLAAEGRSLFRLPLPNQCHHGSFVAPAAFRLNRFDELDREVFGPVLHVVTYEADRLDDLIDAIGRAGYGLTLGVHSRIDARIDHICSRAPIGNIYVNRNQIGAVVGVQPFGGERLSGTGPKAGGPHYVTRFTRPREGHRVAPVSLELDPVTLPGPTGERNSYRLKPKGRVLCLGPTAEDQRHQAAIAARTGNQAILAIDRGDDPVGLAREEECELAVFDGDGQALRELRTALAMREGARIPLIRSDDDLVRWYGESVVSEDTTASGGNASLLAASS